MYNNLFSAFIKYWRKFISSGHHALWISMSKNDEQVCILHIVTASATQSIEGETKRNLCYLQVFVTSVAELNYDSMGKKVNELRMKWQLPQAHIWSMLLCYVSCISEKIQQHSAVLLQQYLRDWWASWDLAADHRAWASFLQCSSSSWLEYPQNECMCEQWLMNIAEGYSNVQAEIFCPFAAPQWYNLAWFLTCLYCSVTSICHLAAFFFKKKTTIP